MHVDEFGEVVRELEVLGLNVEEIFVLFERILDVALHDDLIERVDDLVRGVLVDVFREESLLEVHRLSRHGEVDLDSTPEVGHVLVRQNELDSLLLELERVLGLFHHVEDDVLLHVECVLELDLFDELGFLVFVSQT